jgi:prepilin-type N-terminal cleavage/methylation domain-containing protein
MRGFTLIELVVTMGIMALITSVTLANHSKFGGQVMLRNLAYEMALIVREAQTYGVSVRKINIGSGEFEAGYGVHFNANNPTEYVMFADTYTESGTLIRGEDGMRNTVLEDVNTFKIGRGYKINKFCVGPEESPSCREVCESCSGTLDILFKRPEPDAAIRFNGVESTLYERAQIELRSPRDDLMSVLIEVSGQISVIKL